MKFRLRKKITCAKCDMVLELSRIFKYAYCRACHAEHARKTRPKYGELAPLAKLKSNARALANQYEKRGKLKKQTCFGCGSPDTQKHHEDYTKPLEVTWLCRACHLDYHQWKEKRRVA